METFRHRTPIQLRFKDTDRMGHIHNANYLSYIEEGRLAYFKDVLGTEVNWYRQDGLILARTELDFKQPIFVDDVILVYTRCARLGTKSFDLHWRIVRESHQSSSPLEQADIMAEGLSVLVCYDYETKKAVEIPRVIRRKLEEFEGLVL